MIRPLLAGLTAAALLGAASSADAQQDPAAIARRASRTYGGLRSLRADFDQLIEDRMIGPQTSSGTLVQAGNGHLAMRFTDPKGDAIVLDGTHVWIYTPSTTPGQVIRMLIPHDPVYGPNVLQRILDRPVERYRISWLGEERYDGMLVDRLEFVPNAADPLFHRAEIWFDRDQGLPRRLILNELSGIRRRLDLSDIRPNALVPSEAFVFRVPSGVRVVIQ